MGDRNTDSLADCGNTVRSKYHLLWGLNCCLYFVQLQGVQLTCLTTVMASFWNFEKGNLKWQKARNIQWQINMQLPLQHKCPLTGLWDAKIWTQWQQRADVSILSWAFSGVDGWIKNVIDFQWGFVMAFSYNAQHGWLLLEGLTYVCKHVCRLWFHSLIKLNIRWLRWLAPLLKANQRSHTQPHSALKPVFTMF